MKKLFYLLPVLVACLLSGCVSYSVPNADSRVIISQDLASRIHVSGLYLQKNASGFMTLNVRVQNVTGKEFPAEWKVAWLNQGGMTQESITQCWNRITFGPNEVHILRSTAMSEESVDVKIHFRRIKQ